MKKLIFIFIASFCLIENSNAFTTTIFCPKAARPQCEYEYKTPDATCSDSECEKCKDVTSDIVNNGVTQILKKTFYENCPDKDGNYTCRCKTTPTYKCVPGFYGTATSASTGCTKCPDNALCLGGNNSTFDCVSGYIKNTTLNICEKKDLTCSDNQFIYNGKCYDCPRTGGCDGVNLTCNGGLIQEGPNCICKNGNLNGYIDSSLKCKECPKHATCDGLIFTCNKSFTPTTNECICRSGLGSGLGFISNNQCNKCPANASCDGENFLCNQSFYKTNNTCTQCPHNGTTGRKGATNLSECYLTARQSVNDAGYYEIIDQCYATDNK